jgi:hypothetical protein
MYQKIITDNKVEKTKLVIALQVKIEVPLKDYKMR